MTPLRGTVNYPHLAQIFRIERQREICKSGTKSIEITYGITSVPECRGAPKNYSRGTEGIGRLKTETTVLGMSTSGRTPV